jgi:hypothetical protein
MKQLLYSNDRFTYLNAKIERKIAQEIAKNEKQ